LVPDGRLTLTGTVLTPPVVPLPSCPKVSSPQVSTDPVLVSATVKSQPCRTWVTVVPDASLTLTGTSELSVVPLPSSPSPLKPHPRSVPLVTAVASGTALAPLCGMAAAPAAGSAGIARAATAALAPAARRQISARVRRRGSLVSSVISALRVRSCDRFSAAVQGERLPGRVRGVGAHGPGVAGRGCAHPEQRAGVP